MLIAIVPMILCGCSIAENEQQKTSDNHEAALKHIVNQKLAIPDE